MNTKTMISRLHTNGFCDGNGYPIANTKLFLKSIQEIITYGNQVLRGVMNSNQGCVNYHKGSFIQYIIQFSIAKTLARKMNISMKQTFKKYGKHLTYAFTNSKGIVKTIKLALFRNFKRDKTFFPRRINKIKQPIKIKYDCRNLLERTCYICGIPHHNMMFHRKRKSLLTLPYSNIIKEMIRINRRQVCLCVHCFDKVEYNQLEYNQITRRKSI